MSAKKKTARSRARRAPNAARKSPRKPPKASSPAPASSSSPSATPLADELIRAALGPPGHAGRPSSYSSALHAALVALVTVGVPIAVACRQLHLGRRTLYDWRERGRAGEPPFAELEADLVAAVATAESIVLRTVLAATAEDWKAGAWWLERRFPKRYSAKQQLRVEKAPPDMSDDELAAAIAAYGFVRSSTTPADPADPQPET